MPCKSAVEKWLLSALAFGLFAALCACGGSASSRGTFDRVLNVNGPAELNLSNSNGHTIIHPGSAGQVKIHADVEAHGWTPDEARRHVDEFTANPPIEQQSNLVRIGDKFSGDDRVSIQYTIEVPAQTEVRATSGSGGIDITGVTGPVTLSAGSGDLRISIIQHNVKATSKRGSISIAAVAGDVDATASSGKIEIAAVKGEIRVHTSSGGIDIAGPGGPVTVATSSGNVQISGLTQDARVQALSGNVTVDGKPGPHSYWELGVASGKIIMNIPADSSFHLLAHSASGKISTDIPMIAEESSSKRDLRAHMGTGDARIEVRTTSGDIHLQ